MSRCSADEAITLSALVCDAVYTGILGILWLHTLTGHFHAKIQR